MIRVLHVLAELRASGAEVALQAAGDLWERFGFRCDILATGDTTGPFAGALDAAGYRIHHLPFTGDLGFLRNYAALIRSERYDVVHIHMERASFYTSLTATLAGAKTVRTVRNNFPFEGTLRQRRRLQRRASRALGTRFIAISSSVEQNEWNTFRNPTLRIENWINLDKFCIPSDTERLEARRVLEIPHDALAIATVGNCSPIKNHSALLKALARVKDRRWVWIHVGAADHGATEEALARQLGVIASCRFRGRSDPLTALHAADLYAMPSLYEGLGMATVEAFATGLPALLTDVPGNSDLADITRNITWVAPDVESLSRGLIRAFNIGPQVDSKDAIERQRAAVIARFSPERGVAEYAAVYRDVLRKID